MNALQWVDLGERFDADLLEEAYREVYLPAFPVRDEQEDPAIWTPRLTDPDPHPRLSFLVMGTRLDDPIARRVLGLLVAEYYAASRCMLVSYVAVAEAARRQGVARQLFDLLAARIRSGHASAQQPVAAVLAEIHDPAVTPPGEDVLDPAARLAVMARLGACRIPVHYIQPALSADQAPAHGLWLVAYPKLVNDPTALTAQRVRDFLVEFYDALGSADPLRDPVYAATFASVDALAAATACGQPLLEALTDEYPC
ncbi:MAG: GNAT family N-acetyltransferase [Pseudomonadota bacterium]